MVLQQWASSWFVQIWTWFMFISFWAKDYVVLTLLGAFWRCSLILPFCVSNLHVLKLPFWLLLAQFWWFSTWILQLFLRSQLKQILIDCVNDRSKLIMEKILLVMKDIQKPYQGMTICYEFRLVGLTPEAWHFWWSPVEGLVHLVASIDYWEGSILSRIWHWTSVQVDDVYTLMMGGYVLHLLGTHELKHILERLIYDKFAVNEAGMARYGSGDVCCMSMIHPKAKMRRIQTSFLCQQGGKTVWKDPLQMTV